MPTQSERIPAAQRALLHARADALLLAPGADMRYLTGLGDVHAGERLLALILTAEGRGLWIAPVMNAPQVVDNCGGFEEIRTWTDAGGYPPLLGQALSDLGLVGKTIAVDEEMRARFLLDLQEVCPSARCAGAG